MRTVGRSTGPRERPLLFSGPMVRAILDGRKTQTRRVVKPQPRMVDEMPRFRANEWGFWGGGYPDHGRAVCCPYGEPSDRLWVRETFRLRRDQDGKPPSQDWWKAGAWYPATQDEEPSGCGGGMGKKRAAIHMPRWASRITLEIVDVRVERLQEISAEDCIAEGFATTLREHDAVSDLREQYGAYWDSLHAKGDGVLWASNPWVWPIEFRRL